MTRHLALAAATFAVLAACTAADCPQPDPFDPANFPCAEDEYLGHGPQFGGDRLGCVHADQIAEYHHTSRKAHDGAA